MNRNPESRPDNDWNDRSFDSMLGEFARSGNDSAQFTDKLLRNVEKETVHEQDEQFFGRPSLSESIGIAPTKTLAKETSQPGKRSLLFAVLALSISALIVVGALGAMLFFQNGNQTHLVEESQPDNNSVASDIANSALHASGTKLAAVEKAEPSNLQTHSWTPQAPFAEPPEAHAHNSTIPLAAWHLALTYRPDGIRAALNGEEIEEPIPVVTGRMALRRIEIGVVRRLRYLAPVIAGDFCGRITIREADQEHQFVFNGLDGIHESFGRAAVQLRKITRAQSAPAPENPFPVSTVDDQGWIKTNVKVAEILEPSSVGEIFVGTDAVLHSYANDLLALSNSTPFFSTKDVRRNALKYFRTISMSDLRSFVDTGELNLPKPHSAFVTDKVLQAHSQLALQENLRVLARPINMYAEYSRLTEFADNAYAERPNLRDTPQGRLTAQIRENQNRWEQMRAQLSQWNDAKTRVRLKSQIQELSVENSKLRVKLRSLKGKHPIEPLLDVLPHREDLRSLSLAMGDDCRLDSEDSKVLSHVSTSLGRELADFDPFGTRDRANHTLFRKTRLMQLIKVLGQSRSDQALITMDQMLQIEPVDIRLELIKTLQECDTKTSVDLLSFYARFDLDPQIRAAAIEALSFFPPSSYRQKLIDGFRYPWPEIAKNSADALIRLNDVEAIPELEKLQAEPAPDFPVKDEKGGFFVREVVAINHLKNCLLCHADSQDREDLGRGVVPDWNRSMSVKYYQQLSGIAVRADMTYLRQDFSVIQPVEESSPWPKNQRFDYVVQKRRLSATEAGERRREYSKEESPYQKTIADTLRALKMQQLPMHAHVSDDEQNQSPFGID